MEDLDYLQATLHGPAQLLASLDVSADQGIQTSTCAARVNCFGSNHKDPPTRTPFCTLLYNALDDFMLKLLIVCAIFSITVDMSFATPAERSHAWIEGTAIIFAVAVVSLVGAWSDYKKEGQFLEQQRVDENSKTVFVMRDSKEEEIHKNHIKVGDLIKVVNGMNVPVDGVVIKGVGIMSDESAMTGESDHLPKEGYDKCRQRQREHEGDGKDFSRDPHACPSPVLLSGTQVQTGEGWFICVVVGEMTCEGQILASVEERSNETTPLQAKLEVIATDIGKLGMYAAILIVHALLLRNFIEGMMRREFDLLGGEMASDIANTNCQETFTCDGRITQYVKEWLKYLIVGVAIIVVAVPEGLPLAVMISLAYSVTRMLEDQNFVKRLTSCEIMGGANNICSDKTGTLTKNQMTWTQIWAGQDVKIANPDGALTDLIDTSAFLGNKFTKERLAEAVACNTVGTHENAGATELAMLKFIKRCDIDYHHLRQKYLGSEPMRFPFDSSRKRMSTVLELEEDDATEHNYSKRIHCKGASEIVLATCTHYLNEQGEKVVLDDQMSQQLDQVIKSYARGALRTIAFAYKDLQPNEGGPAHEDIEAGSKIYKIEEGGFTLICIAGIKDIIRDEVPQAVINCNEAGVRVRMVTGDNKITAIAIAKECGILHEGEEDTFGVCMEGPEFNEYVGSLVHKDTRERIVVMGKEADKEIIGNIEHMKVIRSKLKVLARSRPNDKYIMVAGLRQLGDIVAVTGDGTNDAPALRKADVGFAMKTGTQVAHSAADIIIQDDNFASIVKACKWGRNVFDNIRRFLQFQLTVNVVALITSFIGSCVLWESPLAAIQLLWVNLIMDSLASLALATETPKDDLLQRPPYRKKEYIISKKMVKHILGMSIYQAIILFVIVFAGHTFIPEGAEGVYNTANDESRGITAQQVLDHPVEKYRTWNADYVFNGMVRDFDGSDIYKPFQATTPSRHLSVVFNLFVLLQIFNMLAARKINDEVNIFSGIFTNAMFISVWLIIVGGQVCMVQFGGRVMKVHIAGLTGTQWVICLIGGFSALIVDLILKFFPDHIWPSLGDETEEEIRESKFEYEEIRKNGQLNKSKTTVG